MPSWYGEPWGLPAHPADVVSQRRQPPLVPPPLRPSYAIKRNLLRPLDGQGKVPVSFAHSWSFPHHPAAKLPASLSLFGYFVHIVCPAALRHLLFILGLVQSTRALLILEAVEQHPKRPDPPADRQPPSSFPPSFVRSSSTRDTLFWVDHPPASALKIPDCLLLLPLEIRASISTAFLQDKNRQRDTRITDA